MTAGPQPTPHRKGKGWTAATLILAFPLNSTLQLSP